MDELVVKDLIDRLIDLSFAEDIGDGDHTTLSCIPADAMGKSKLLIKEEGRRLVQQEGPGDGSR
jgi:nicotinate-nucleotide pyrophosphorylase (carboxylating)